MPPKHDDISSEDDNDEAQHPLHAADEDMEVSDQESIVSNANPNEEEVAPSE
jgi:hypothetical protein